MPTGPKRNDRAVGMGFVFYQARISPFFDLLFWGCDTCNILSGVILRGDHFYKAEGGIEPPSKDLQSFALPLCYTARIYNTRFAT